MKFRLEVRLVPLFLLLMLLAACGAQAEPEVVPTLAVIDNSNDTSNTEAVGPGEYTLAISGAVTSDGTYAGEANPNITYEPYNSSNRAGQRVIEIITDITGTELVGPATVIIRFPATITPGDYPINAPSNVAPELVQAFLTFDDFGVYIYEEDVTGTFTVTQADNLISATFNFTANALVEGSDAKTSVEVNGSVTGVPFNPRQEADVTLSGFVEREYTRTLAFDTPGQNFAYEFDQNQYTGEFMWGARYFHQSGNEAEVSFALAQDVEPGTYEVAFAPVGNLGVPDGLKVGARIFYEDPISGINFAADVVSGTVTIAVDGRGFATNTFEITGTDSDSGQTIVATGSFSRFENILGQVPQRPIDPTDEPGSEDQGTDEEGSGD